MSRRVGVKNSTNFNFRLSDEELERHRALAEYLGVELSRLIRDLLDERRQQLVSEGKRPPLRRRNGDG